MVRTAVSEAVYRGSNPCPGTKRVKPLGSLHFDVHILCRGRIFLIGYRPTVGQRSLKP